MTIHRHADPTETRRTLASERPFVRLWLFVTGLVALAGCSSWNTNASWNSDISVAPTDAADEALVRSSRQVRHQSGSVVLQADFITFEQPTNEDDWASIWQWTDETLVDPDSRRRWADNGLRVGWVTDDERLSRRLAAMSPESSVVDDFMKQVEVSGDSSGLDKSIPMRTGTRYELTVCPALSGETTVLASLDGKLVGQTLVSPQPLFAIMATSGEIDQTIRLTLKPEIQHGAMRQSFTPSRAGVRMDHRRESWVLGDLELVTELSEGDTLLIAPSQESMGLGEMMLTQQSIQRKATCTALKLTVQSIPRVDEGL